MKKIKVGIIGAGRIGRVHAESITYHVPEAELVKISDPFITDDTKSWADNMGIAHSCLVTDHDEIFNDEAIKVVLICSPTSTHSEFIQKAANAGKHVFCEKPVDLDVSRIVETLKIVKEAGVKLQVGFNRRFDHNFAKLRELVQGGKIGQPHILKITSRDPAPPPVEYIKNSGTIFLDMMIHDLDMSRFLIGSEVEKVYAQGDCFIDKSFADAGDVDTAVVVLTFKNGVIATIDNSRKAVYGYDQRVEVFGEKGAVEIGNDTASTVKISTEESVTEEKPLHFFLERYMDAYATEIKEFFKAIAHDTETACTGIDGLEPVKIGLAAIKSMKENRPVLISEIA